MNGPMEPRDEAIRRQLARRASGHAPEGLASRVLDALDREPIKPRLAWLPGRGGSGGLRAPGPVMAAAGLALVLVVAGALAVAPGLVRGPAATGLAGYPADRALTTAELAVLLSGPDLPVNAALVASVTITAKPDVCPMNRYPTVGVVDGMADQVCVMGANVGAYLDAPSVTGTFAFRYLARGYLGLLGETAPKSASRLAFQVGDDWPLDSAFLVEGWLGATALSGVACDLSLSPGDPLLPEGDDCPYQDWLSDEPSAPLVPSATPSAPATEALGLLGTARQVFAGGARYFDSIDPAKPVHGIFVVRAIMGPCPGASPVDSRGCMTWRVLAKLADLALPVETSTITPPPTGSPAGPETPIPYPSESQAASPSTAFSASSSASTDWPIGQPVVGLLGPGNRPLTVDEFQRLWASDPSALAGRIVITKGPIPSGFACQGAMSAGCKIVILEGLLAQEGYFAVRVGVDGLLAVIGELAAPGDGFVFTLDTVHSLSIPPDRVLVVDAWLNWTSPCEPSATRPADACTSSILRGDARPLDPAGAGGSESDIEVQPQAWGMLRPTGPAQAARALYLITAPLDGHAKILARLETAP